MLEEAVRKNKLECLTIESFFLRILIFPFKFQTLLMETLYPALLTNIIQGYKNYPRINALAYYTSSETKKKV